MEYIAYAVGRDKKSMTEKLNLPAVSFMGENALPPEIEGYSAGGGVKRGSSLISEADAVGVAAVDMKGRSCSAIGIGSDI